jgi:hypothetical protein
MYNRAQRYIKGLGHQRRGCVREERELALGILQENLSLRLPGRSRAKAAAARGSPRRPGPDRGDPGAELPSSTRNRRRVRGLWSSTGARGLKLRARHRTQAFARVACAPRVQACQACSEPCSFGRVHFATYASRAGAQRVMSHQARIAEGWGGGGAGEGRNSCTALRRPITRPSARGTCVTFPAPPEARATGCSTQLRAAAARLPPARRLNRSAARPPAWFDRWPSDFGV